jgi:DNA-binding transcriptional ArsR family regulator
MEAPWNERSKKERKTELTMDGKEVRTSIDKLVDYLNDHGETDSDLLINALKIDETTLSVWANALEEAHVVKIEYKFAKMYMSLMFPSNDKRGAKKSEEGRAVKNEITSVEIVERIKELLTENKYDGVGLPPE